MKPIIVFILATYLVFTIVDLICCPTLYQKLFYRACFDALGDEHDAELVAKSMAKDFTRANAYIPVVHIFIFIVAFMHGTIYAFEKLIYEKFMANKDVIIDEFNRISK